MRFVYYNPTRPIILSETEKAWLACAIDGEGCITFTKTGGKYRAQWRVVADISNNNMAFLKYAQRIVRYGNIYRDRRRDEAYRLRITADACRLFLPELLPYLIIKRKKAKIAIQALQVLDERAHKGNKRELIRVTELRLQELWRLFKEP